MGPSCPQKPASPELSQEHQELMIEGTPRFPGSPAPSAQITHLGSLGRDEARQLQGCKMCKLSSQSRHIRTSRMELEPGVAFPNPGLFFSLIYQSSLGASWAPSAPPAKECFLPTSKRSLCTSFPVATSCAGPAWVSSSAPHP